MSVDPCLRLLGLMRRANSISVTESSCEDDIRKHRSCLMLFASDCSQRAKDRMEKIAVSCGVETVSLRYSKTELAGALGRGACSMVSINDRGFVRAFRSIYL